MDQKRLFAAIALSIGILLIFQYAFPPPRPPQTATPPTQSQTAPQQAQSPAAQSVLPSAPQAGPGTRDATSEAGRAPAARLPIEAPRLAGSVNLRGARLDDVILSDYRETVEPNSPRVRLLGPRDSARPYFIQWGWTQADGRTRVPDPDTDWTATGGPLGPGRTVTLSWDNGAGVTFEILLSLDANYMVTADQRVRNATSDPVLVLPWARVRRDYTPAVEGFFILHEGFTGVIGGRLNEVTYSTAKTEAARRNGVAFDGEGAGGWAGITDKYWLAAIMPAAPTQQARFAYRAISEGPGTAGDRWQVDIAAPAAEPIAPGAVGSFGSRAFAGAKEVLLLDAYRDNLQIQDFDKAIDFGWFYFLTKPFFYALHWIAEQFSGLGAYAPYGLAILVFTLLIKIAFFPLANKAYHSMARMKVLGPKMTEIKERYKDDPQKAQAEMMGLYKSEKINPASGCLPILLQIPVFFALYKVLFISIEMRHQPFYGWVRDLSGPDTTNLFNLFGLLPFDPVTWSSYLHMPAWALIMGVTMFVQQKLNPQPPDPVQAKIFAWMPVLFTFMLASFPAGLIIYWAWNNTLSVAQQYYIMRHDRAASRAAKKTT